MGAAVHRSRQGRERARAADARGDRCPDLPDRQVDRHGGGLHPRPGQVRHVGDARKGKLAQARKLESAASIRGILHLAATEATIAIMPDDVDADVFLLNCTNCTVDLRTMTLHAHDPADLLTKMTGAAYDPGATGPGWAKFLARVQPDEAMHSYLARLTGHALEGRVTAHLLPIFAGSGANGKSTYVNAVTAALGDYAGPPRTRTCSPPGPLTRTPPGWPTCSASGWRSCMRPTPGGGWPKAPSSG
jgi:hypothetical protein